MSSWLNKNSFKVKDEYYTPDFMVESIVKYLKPKSKVWLPFDKKESSFVKVLNARGFETIYGHIEDGKDFFDYEPEDYDYIVSNPPFSLKLKILKRLYDLDKPFAVLLGLPILNYQVIGNFFLGKNLELLIFDKKVSFDGNTASFNTSFFCNKVLPKQIIFEHLEHNNSSRKQNYAKE